MEELAYTLNDKKGVEITYTIVQYASEDVFDFMPNGGTVRKAKKQNGKWVQLSGADTDPEILQELGGFMDGHHMHQEDGNQ